MLFLVTYCARKHNNALSRMPSVLCGENVMQCSLYKEHPISGIEELRANRKHNYFFHDAALKWHDLNHSRYASKKQQEH